MENGENPTSKPEPEPIRVPDPDHPMVIPSRRKKYLSRKLTAFIINDVILVSCYLITLEVAPTLLVPAVIIAFMALIVLNGITYIGGKALETWAKSKWFRSELL